MEVKSEIVFDYILSNGVNIMVEVERNAKDNQIFNVKATRNDLNIDDVITYSGSPSDFIPDEINEKTSLEEAARLIEHRIILMDRAFHEKKKNEEKNKIASLISLREEDRGYVQFFVEPIYDVDGEIYRGSEYIPEDDMAPDFFSIYGKTENGQTYAICDYETLEKAEKAKDVLESAFLEKEHMKNNSFERSMK
jgi:hypothetical protein